jgi:uncharacterized protein YycO
MLLSIMEQEWFQIILGALALGVAGLITWAFTIFQAWLNTKIKNENLRAVLDAVLDIVQKSVLAIQQTFVEQLKKDGKFDKEKQQEALKKAVDLALSNISAEAKKILEENFGNLEDWLTMQIEALVLRLPGHSNDITKLQ